MPIFSVIVAGSSFAGGPPAVEPPPLIARRSVTSREPVVTGWPEARMPPAKRDGVNAVRAGRCGPGVECSRRRIRRKGGAMTIVRFTAQEMEDWREADRKTPRTRKLFDLAKAHAEQTGGQHLNSGNFTWVVCGESRL
jgi:hypothetical protein